MATAPTGDLLIESVPSSDWLPVFKPIIYKFKDEDLVSAITNSTLIVRIEVSGNGVDFDEVLIPGTMNLLSDLESIFTVNPAPYLASMFTPAPPDNGSDANLFKLYRLAVGRSKVYDGTNTPEIITAAAYCIYASEYNEPTGSETIISKATGIWNFNGYIGIRTVIDTYLGAVSNDVVFSTGIKVCPKYPIQLYWLNRFGGWQTWVFDGKHEYGDEVGDGVTWQDENGVTHTASVGPVLQKVNVFSGFINKEYFETINGIRHAIRVYHKDGSEWREVNIERGSFPRYKEGDKRREVNFSFTYAEPLIIQQA